MTKIEFLSILRGRLTGSIPSGEVESQLDYYSAYIDGRIGAGLTEEEAVEELGDPQLIAKTVIESMDRSTAQTPYRTGEQGSTDSQGSYERGATGTDRQSSFGSGAGCIVALIIFVLLMVLGWVLTAFVFRVGFWLFIWAFPVIAVIAIVVLIFRMARRK